MSTVTLGGVVIRASAGTGKTWRLGNRYIGLLALGAEPADIVAATFSRKAAGEILERVLTRLARASLDPAAGAALGADVGVPSLTATDAGDLLRALTRELHRARVSTFDSFFGDVARGFGHELGLPPGWEMADDDDARRLRVEAVDAALREYDMDDLLAVLRARHEGALRQSVVADFDELVSALHACHGEAPAEAWGAVTHGKASDAAALAAAGSALRAEAISNKTVAKARDALVEALGRGDWEALKESKLLNQQARGEPFAKVTLSGTFQGACEVVLGHARWQVVAALGQVTRAAYALVSAFDLRYRALQRQRRMLRFEDVARALGRGAIAERLEEVFLRLDGRTEHLLLDEFQDTSPAQWRVLRPFAGEATRAGSLFVVGDVKQAIYGWRGGVAEIFEAVQSELPGLAEEFLEKSQRSSPVIIGVVNEVCAHLGAVDALKDQLPAAERWAGAFREHTTARETFGGFVEVRTAPEPEAGEEPGDATLACAAGLIKALADAHPGRTVGVLARTNGAVAALTDRLRALHVDVSGEGTSPLTSSRAVEVVLSLLRFADHPGDTVARYHVARSPLGAVVGLTDHASRDVARRLSLSLRAELLRDGYGACLYRWAAGLAPSCDARDLRWLLKLVELGHDFDAAATLRPSDFVAWVGQTRVPDGGRAAVRVMNVHQSKGLQFDLVVLPELDGSFVREPEVLLRRETPLAPVTAVSLCGRKAVRAGSDLESMRDAAMAAAATEALNLLYVALTRAVHALHVVVAPDSPARRRGASLSDVLRATLCPGAAFPPDSRVFARGDEGWFGAPPTVAATTPVEPVRVALKPSRHARKLERRRPSSSHGAAEETLSSRMAPPNRYALEQGTLIHAFFERVSWVEDGLPDRASLLRLARVAGFPARAAEEKVDWFESMLWLPEVRRVMCREGYVAPGGDTLELRREFPFTQREEGSLVNGVIDRLVLHRRGGKVIAADVIDFKTDAVVPSDEETVAARVEFHREQMEAYRQAVSRMERVAPERVRARLLFVTAGVVREV